MEKERGITITNVDDKKQCDIHVVVEPFYCDDADERLTKCKKQCKYCLKLNK